MKLYNIKDKKLLPVFSDNFKLEKDIQELVENNLKELFNLELVKTEFTIRNFRIDTLCFNKENKSASTAKERLQIIIARERTIHNGPDFMPALHQELIAVISKYVQVNPEDIKISLDRQGNLEVLDVNVVLPDATASN